MPRGVLISIFISLLFSFRFSAEAKGKLDSLKSLYIDEISEKEAISVLSKIVRYSVYDEDSTLKYAGIFYDLALAKESEFVVDACGYLGQANMAKGNYETALDYLLIAMKFKPVKNNTPDKIAWVKGILASLYGKMGDLEKMKLTYFEAIDLSNNAWREAEYLNGIGEAYFINQEYDSALIYYGEALAIGKSVDFAPYVRLFQGNIGMTYNRLGRYQEAQELLELTVAGYADGEDALSQSIFLYHLGETYMNLGASQGLEVILKQSELGEMSFIDKAQVADSNVEFGIDWIKLDKAEKVLIQSLEIGFENGLKAEIRDASKLLSRYKRLKKDYVSALKFSEIYHVYSDSIENLENVKKMARMHESFEVGQKQTEVNILTIEKRNQRNILVATGLLALLLLALAMVIYKYYRDKAKVNMELERLNAMKDKFFSIISHDLRGPVSSFKGVGRIIKFMVEAKQTENLVELADDIEESADQLSSLLDNLLNWAMQQQGQFPYHPEMISLNEMICDLVGTLSLLAKSKSIELVVAIPQSLSVYVDRETTMTIFRNLINNALKFTPENGSVTISGTQGMKFTEISIKDTGFGISKHQMKHLFRMSEGHRSYGTSGETGLGLGLQLVNEFIKLNKGSIHVESEIGVGSVFILKLPIL